MTYADECRRMVDLLARKAETADPVERRAISARRAEWLVRLEAAYRIGAR